MSILKMLIETVYTPQVLKYRQELIQRDNQLLSKLKQQPSWGIQNAPSDPVSRLCAKLLGIRFPREGIQGLPRDPILRTAYLNSIFYYQHEPALSLRLAVLLSITHFVQGEEAQKRLENIYRKILEFQCPVVQELIPSITFVIESHLSSESRKNFTNLGNDLLYEIRLLGIYLDKVKQNYSKQSDPDSKVAYHIALAYAGRTVVKLREYVDRQEVKETDLKTVSSYLDTLDEVVFQDPHIIQLGAEEIKKIEKSAYFTLQPSIFFRSLLTTIHYLRFLPFPLDELFFDPNRHSEYRRNIVNRYKETPEVQTYEELQEDLRKVVELSEQYQAERFFKMTESL